MTLSELKPQTFSACINLLDNKIQELQSTLDDLNNSAQSDAKSTAGDKHETARAHVQYEQEKTGKQLAEAFEQKSLLERLNLDSISDTVGLGSLVRTNRGFLFIAIGLGRVWVENEPVLVISPAAPLGQKLIGLRVSNLLEMNGVAYRVEELG
jgi:hypothetical protein